MHHCFAVVWRRSLELNPCRIKFIKTKEYRYGKEEEGHEEEIEGDVRPI
jgi:hypothetical protein